MTKSNLIHHIISTWAGELKVIRHWSFTEQEELVKRLSKELMLKKKKRTAFLDKRKW